MKTVTVMRVLKWILLLTVIVAVIVILVRLAQSGDFSPGEPWPTSTSRPTASHPRPSQPCYRDVNGACAPQYSPTFPTPGGATARCRDGTYSFSEHRRGSCASHGGVAAWLDDLPWRHPGVSP